MRIVVIGHGMVGHRFVEVLARDAAALHLNTPLDVTVLAEENRPAYDRVQLSAYFSGKTAEDLSLVDPHFFDESGFKLHLGQAAASIDRAAKIVTTKGGEQIPYDKLVLATGSYPFVPPVKGNDREECLVYRTIEDLEAMKASATRSKIGVVVGGGLLGLEAAKALRDLGLQTHVVEFAPRLMAVQIDDGAGKLLRSKIEALGCGRASGQKHHRDVDGETCRHRMNFADGSHLETDMILFSAGIRPRDELARSSGLSVGARGGIEIDNDCRTSDADVYAIGECALWGGRIYGLVAPAIRWPKPPPMRLLPARRKKNLLVRTCPPSSSCLVSMWHPLVMRMPPLPVHAAIPM
jgi:nitrite reductase (NADH) large subunit